MNKTKFFALIAVSAIFFACGSNDGSSPVINASDNNLVISPFDTLIAKFDSKVSTPSIDEGSPGDLISAQKSNKEWKITGNFATTPGGLVYFEPNKKDSIVFLNVTNDDGYRTQREVLTFTTIPILDHIEGDNDEQEKAVELNFTKNITFAGVLDHRITGSKYNMEDYYKIILKANDVLEISVTSRDTLSINITEPGKNSLDTIFGVSPKKENNFKLTIGSGHLSNTDLFGKTTDFYIKIYDSNSAAPPNPYTLSISLN